MSAKMSKSSSWQVPVQPIYQGMPLWGYETSVLFGISSTAVTGIVYSSESWRIIYVNWRRETCGCSSTDLPSNCAAYLYHSDQLGSDVPQIFHFVTYVQWLFFINVCTVYFFFFSVCRNGCLYTGCGICTHPMYCKVLKCSQNIFGVFIFLPGCGVL